MWLVLQLPGTSHQNKGEKSLGKPGRLALLGNPGFSFLKPRLINPNFYRQKETARFFLFFAFDLAA
jgi:hypothetical protein